MTFADDVKADIATIGGSKAVVVKTATEVEDAYGNASATYSAGTSYSGLVSRVPHEEKLREFGAVTGKVIKVHLPYDCTVVEHDKLTISGDDWIVLKVVWTDFEDVGISKKTVYARELIPSA